MKEMKVLRAPTARPSAAQIGWHKMERSMFIHYGPSTWQYNEGDDLSTPLTEINPVKLDVQQWCDAAKSFGAKQIVFVAKHVGGFCWWQTKTTDYAVSGIPWKDGKGDVVDELYQCCQKNGLHFGIYLSPQDRSQDALVGGRAKDPEKQEAYNALYREQLTELCSKYDIDELWCDGGIIVPIADIVKKYIPNAVVFQGRELASIRWCGNEEGCTPYPSYDTLKKEHLETGLATSVQSDPNGDVWAGLEVDTPLYNHNWFWAPENEKKRKTLDELMKIYYNSVGHGAMLLLNATPNTDGLIPVDDMKRYAEFGAEIERRFGIQLAGKKKFVAEGAQITFDGMQKINHVQVCEDICFGQRVRKFELDVHTADGWKTVYEGSTIGNCHIAVFDTVEADAVRIDVLETAGMPVICEISAHYVTDVNIPEWIKVITKETHYYDGLREVVHSIKVGPLKEAMKNGVYAVDMSEHITKPGQYHVFCECAWTDVPLQQPNVILDGALEPEMLGSAERGVIVNRTAMVLNGSQSVLTATIQLDPHWPDDYDVTWYIERC